MSVTHNLGFKANDLKVQVFFHGPAVEILMGTFGCLVQ